MTMETVTLQKFEAIGHVIGEHFQPGTRLALELDSAQEISGTQRFAMERYLREHGLSDAAVRVDAPGRLVIHFTYRPRSIAPQGNFVPAFMVGPIILGALALVGIVVVTAFALKPVGEAVTSNFLPLALIIGGVILGVAYVNSKARA